MMVIRKNILLMFVSLVAVMLVFALTLPLVKAETDFSGKTIQWIIPFKEGGGSDKWSRFYAPLLSKALPGNPNVVVKNVPGGGSTKGANLFAKQAKPNGLTILGTSGSTQFPYLLDDKRVKYEYSDWNIVLGTPTGGVVYVSSELPSDIKLLQRNKLKYASQGATSLDLIPLLAFELLGLDVQAVFGFKGRGGGFLAFSRKETNIDYQTSSSYLKKVGAGLVKEGKAKPLFAYGTLDANGNLQRDPTFPDLPHFGEVYESVHGQPPSGEAFEAWKTFFTAGFPAQKMVFLPKGTPQDIIDTYTNAFNTVIASQEFKNTSQKRLGVYPQSTGKNAKNLQQQATSVDAKSKQWIKNWLKERYNVKL